MLTTSPLSPLFAFLLYFLDDHLICQPIVFDKDNEEEGHVDFISAAAVGIFLLFLK